MDSSYINAQKSKGLRKNRKKMQLNSEISQVGFLMLVYTKLHMEYKSFYNLS